MRIREYSEGYDVDITQNKQSGRVVIQALNNEGRDWTEVDLLDVLKYVKENIPEMWEKA